MQESEQVDNQADENSITNNNNNSHEDEKDKKTIHQLIDFFRTQKNAKQKDARKVLNESSEQKSWDQSSIKTSVVTVENVGITSLNVRKKLARL